MRINFPAIGLICVAFLSGCSSYDFSRRTLQQGNLITQKKLNQLKIGMSKEKAAIIMGTSLLSSTFNDNRWDYAYTWRKGNGPILKQHLALYFKNDTLTHIEHGSGNLKDPAPSPHARSSKKISDMLEHL